MRLVPLLALAAVGLQAGEPVHPRLLFGQEDVPKLREKITKAPFTAMVERLKLAAEKGGEWTSDNPVGKKEYNEAITAFRLGFLYQLTGDDAYAKKARPLVQTRITDKDWANAGDKGLELYMNGAAVAYAYDWCHGAPSWDSEFSNLVSKKLAQQAEIVRARGGSQQNFSPASNWRGGRYSSAGSMYLATDEAVDPSHLDQCYSEVAGYLKANLGDGKGWNAEGLGYTFYPGGIFVAPFGVAMQRKDPQKDIRTASKGTPWMLWTTYAAAVASDWKWGLYRPDFGDDNPGCVPEGTWGFAFWWCPQELQPGFKFMYDRGMGDKSIRKLYDDARFGTIASILFHPGDSVKEQDPVTLPKWREGFDDRGGNGFFTFRNTYEPQRDVVVQLFGKLREAGGHGGPDANSIRIAGMNGMWVMGGGRYGKGNVFWKSQGTVYPLEPDLLGGNKGDIDDRRQKLVGEPTWSDSGGGTVVCRGDNDVKTKNLTRRLAVEFARGIGTDAAIVDVCTSDNGRYWQIPLFALHDITLDEAGGTFLVTSTSGQSLKGTVVHPKGAKLATGIRPRGSDIEGVKENKWVTVKSDDGAFAVVLTMAAKGGTHPAVKADGAWAGAPKGVITVGAAPFTIDGDRIDLK